MATASEYYIPALEQQVDKLRAQNRELIQMNCERNAQIDELYETINDLNRQIAELSGEKKVFVRCRRLEDDETPFP